MREVIVKIQFTTESLGNIRHADCDKFQRDEVTGKVKFMPGWWKGALEYGAQALGKYQGEAKKVSFHHLVDGEVHYYKRFYKNKVFKLHEAFLSGDVITVTAMVPESLPLDAMSEMMNTAGKYNGISPYGWREDTGYGRFRVISVEEPNKESKNGGA